MACAEKATKMIISAKPEHTSRRLQQVLMIMMIAKKAITELVTIRKMNSFSNFLTELSSGTIKPRASI